LTDSAVLRRAQAVRHFNRFYTKHIGALHERLQKCDFSLTEVRVLHELSRSDAWTASALARNLGLDSGYLSRLLTSFERRNLISRRPSDVDARQSLLALTDDGRIAYEPLNAAAVDEVSATLERLDPASQEQLISAMRLVERLLDQGNPRDRLVTLRAPLAGEYGWLVHRQAQLFAVEHGWDRTFEGLLAQVVAEFAQNQDPVREAGWVAEMDGVIVGSAFVVGESATVARVRLLYVEPDVRRMGIGRRLLDECARFATQAGYTKLTLCTASTLQVARRLCEQDGFVCAASAHGQRFGSDLTMERWEREL
jgi:DNA-binding MarR family transcriptional regulator/GNAT superfamily N-acetyltransferase